MTSLLWLLLVVAGVIVGAGWWQHRRDQLKFRKWIQAVEQAEQAQGYTDQVNWNWEYMRERRKQSLRAGSGSD